MSWFLERMRIDGETLDARVESAVTAGEHLRTMKGASTVELTIHDPDRTLLRTGVLVKKGKSRGGKNKPATAKSNLRIGETRLALDGDPYLLASYGKTGSNLVLRFEHEITALMRRHTRPQKASRSRYSRAQFILHFLVRTVRERHIYTDFRSFKAQPAYEPGDNPDTKRKVEKLNQRKLQAPNVTVGGDRPDSTQRHNINLVLQAINDENAGELASLALIEACIVEPALPPDKPFYNPIGGDDTSSGILQLTGAKAGPPSVDGSTSTRGGRRDVKLVATTFLRSGFTGAGGAIELAVAHPGWKPGQIAQACQGSAYPERYEQHRAEAEAILSGGGGAGGTIEVQQRYIFRVGNLDGQREDYWEGGVRLAEEVNAHFFVANGVLTYGFDRDFFSRPPVAMVAEAPTGRQHDVGAQHVGNIDFEQFLRHAVEEVHFTARADQFFAFPGATIEVVDPNLGPAVGKYLIDEIRDTLGSLDVDVTCRRPMAALKEPAAPTTTVQLSDPEQTGPARTRLMNTLEYAYKNKRSTFVYVMVRPYPSSLYGPPPVRVDCSSFVTLAFKAAHIADPNGLGYNGQGNTVTLRANATRTTKPQPGDLCLFGSGSGASAHVNIYAGNGMAYNMGGAGLNFLPFKVRPDFVGYFSPSFEDSGT